ncbi:MAG TPA: ABC transporter ATP-binding protein [Myxococcales bacterium]|nr:ABC transporter ATP-binding protein [Myxococcales bacterium]
MSETPLLEVRGLHVFYGHVHAVRGVSLTVRRGQIAALIGPNGAGKSSTLNAIAGLLRPAAGEVLLDGQPLARLPAHRVARSGAVLVPEGRGILQRMTVEENLKVAAEMHPGRDLRERIDGQLRRFPSLERRRDLPAGQLSGGEQQMLAIARALLQRPRLLLLDEPSMGLSPVLVRQVFDILAGIQREGIALLLVEQNARAALALSEHAYVLERGRIALDGLARDLYRDERLQAAYLGGDVKA